MTKFLIVAITFAVVAVSAQDPGSPKNDEYWKYMEICKTETGATDDDMKALMSLQPSEKSWCLLGCIKKKSGAMSSDNKLNLNKIQQEMAPMKEHHPERYEKMMSAMQQCKTEVEFNAANLASACTAAKALGECIKNKT